VCRRQFLAAAVSACGALPAHTYHTSIAQIEHISTAKSLEIMLWLHAEDVEAQFRQAHGRNATLDDKTKADAFVSAYLQKMFELRDTAGQKPVAVRWVGMEVRVHFLTIYLEAAAPATGLAGLSLRNRILMHLPDQLNIVKVRQDGKDRNDLEFQHGKPDTLPLLRS